MASPDTSGFTLDYALLLMNQALVAFTLGLGSGVWRKLRCRRITRWVCHIYPKADQSHITAVLHSVSWLMPVSYVLFVLVFRDEPTLRRLGTLFYQFAIIYLIYIVFKALDRRKPFLREARKEKDELS